MKVGRVISLSAKGRSAKLGSRAYILDRHALRLSSLNARNIFGTLPTHSSGCTACLADRIQSVLPERASQCTRKLVLSCGITFEYF